MEARSIYTINQPQPELEGGARLSLSDGDYIGRGSMEMSVRERAASKTGIFDENGVLAACKRWAGEWLSPRRRQLQSIFAELVGTFLFILLSCGACVRVNRENFLQEAMMWGVSATTIVWIFGHLSGAHLNPAITLAFVVTRKLGPLVAIGYAIAQFIGALCAVAAVDLLQQHRVNATSYLVSVTVGLGYAEALLIEFTLTMVLVIFVFATADPNRTDLHGSRAWATGLCLVVLIATGSSFTGPGLNPARCLAPAIIEGNFKDLWVYFTAPLAGAVAGAFFYQFLLAAPSPTPQSEPSYSTL